MRESAATMRVNINSIVSNFQMPGEANAQWGIQSRDWEALRENDTLSALQNLHNTVMI